MHREAAAVGIVPQFPKLQLRALLAGGHPGVDRHPRRASPTSASAVFCRTLYYRFVHTPGSPRKSPEMLGAMRSESEGFSAQAHKGL